MGKIPNHKYFALNEEFRTANKLIRLGLGELQNISLSNDFYFLPFQLLSQGLERFMKAYVCLGYCFSKNELPPAKYILSLGHDLEKLLGEIIKEYYIIHNGEQFKIDKKFLIENERLKQLLFILSEFGKLARYHNFDVITDNKKIGINPTELWENFENKIAPNTSDRLQKLLNPDSKHEIFDGISRTIVTVFEQFISALTRQFIFGTLGQLGKQLISGTSLFDFGLVYQGKFGVTDYKKETNYFKQRQKKSTKRTIADEVRRRFNSNYKSKRITKKQFRGEWPFLVDEVIIECRHERWCVVTIEKKDYALNGTAKGRYKIETPHEGGSSYPRLHNRRVPKIGPKPLKSPNYKSSNCPFTNCINS